MVDTTPDVPISPVDAASLQLGVHVQPYLVTIAGLLAPGGFVDRDGRPDLVRLHRTLAAHIAQEPLLRQRPIMRNGSWWWTENDIDFDLHLSLDERGPTEPDFESVCGRLVMQPLDTTRPLWRIAFVPAARPGLCGIVIRVHHAVLDGARASDLFERLFASPDCEKYPTRALPVPNIPPKAAGSLDLLRFRIGTFLPPANPITGVAGRHWSHEIDLVRQRPHLSDRACRAASGRHFERCLSRCGGRRTAIHPPRMRRAHPQVDCGIGTRRSHSDR